MLILIALLKAAAAFIILMFTGTNLLGIMVRGFLQKSVIVIIISVLVSIAYFFSLYYWGNLGIAVAASMVMFARLPDQLFELKTRKKITNQTMPKKPIDIFCVILYWLAIPILFYSFYVLQ